MLGVLLWVALTVSLYVLGLRMWLRPDERIPGYTWGAMPPVARVRILGMVLVLFAVVCSVFLPFVLKGAGALG